jgi:hypothetical protein
VDVISLPPKGLEDKGRRVKGRIGVTHHIAITQKGAEEEGRWRNKMQGNGKDKDMV